MNKLADKIRMFYYWVCKQNPSDGGMNHKASPTHNFLYEILPIATIVFFVITILVGVLTSPWVLLVPAFMVYVYSKNASSRSY